jgi:SNF2 family DNA or RNA helicase
MALAFWKRKKLDTVTDHSAGAAPLPLSFNDIGLIHPYTSQPNTDTDCYWQGLQEDNLTDLIEGQYVLQWLELFQLLEDEEDYSALPLLNLPASSDLRPMIRSQGALSDPDFQITLSGWCDVTGQKINQNVTRTGAILNVGGQLQLLSAARWKLIEEIRAFSRLGSQKTRLDNQQYWGKIRRLAKQAQASMDDFLQKTIVLSPETLQLNMRRNNILNDAVIEIQPDFEDAPQDWIKTFDQFNQVQDQYSVSLPDGGVAHVMISPEVKSVLNEIKKMPNRRVSGERAQTFLHNPYAQLGEEAAAVVSPDSFEQSKQAAEIFSYDLQIEIHRNLEELFESATLTLDEQSERNAPAITLALQHPEHARYLLAAYHKAHSQFSWAGYDIPLSNAVHAQINTLQHAIEQLDAATAAAQVADVLDLSNYSDRVVDIGARPVLSPEFIQRDSGESGWLPEQVDDWFKQIEAHLSPELAEEIEQRIQQAEHDPQALVTLPHLAQPLSLAEAKAVQQRVQQALEDDSTQTDDESPIPEPLEPVVKPERSVLIIESNLDEMDYSTQRAQQLHFDLKNPPAARLPRSFRSGEFSLKAHQLTGVAWLQNLHRFAPEQINGCLLADDMGLGKTLQLLCFIGEYLEATPEKKPVLIVAPVSLLENWQAEANRFFNSRFAKMLSLYGDAVKIRKIQKHAIPSDLQARGICNLLEDGWRGDADIVLTTYETLRDLEFSFAREHWSIMVCDEAQKIKVPSAMVTQAAKAQQADFKIACTGTPVENSLTDLWCLFDFIQAGLLGSLRQFGKDYRQPIERAEQNNEDALQQLRQLIEPQILRRMKSDLGKNVLPEKTEIKNCKNLPISNLQQQLYANVVADYRKADDADRGRAILGALHKMRMICAHPLQLQPSASERESPKVAWLINTLEQIKTKQEKVIIFTEFREIQAFLQRIIGQYFGLDVEKVNGDTSANSSKGGLTRQRLIDQFQEKSGFNVIILSTTAVGFGVNVQKANHVIHYTRCWNPAKEDQATDRAYRIGQEKEVFVYYPSIYSSQFDTFEVKLDHLLADKRKLADDMLNGTPEISAKELAAHVFN